MANNRARPAKFAYEANGLTKLLAALINNGTRPTKSAYEADELTKLLAALTENGTRPAKIAYGLDELTKLLGLGRSTLYLEVRAGRLKVTKVGKRSIVLADDLAEYLASMKEGNSASSAKAGPHGDRVPVANSISK